MPNWPDFFGRIFSAVVMRKLSGMLRDRPSDASTGSSAAGSAAVPAAPGLPAISADAPPQVRSQQSQQQVKQAVEGALQQARPMPEEK